jgi:beta-galactosidase
MKRIAWSVAAVIVLTFFARIGLADSFSIPDSPRLTLNFNPDWKFIRQDVPGAEATDFDDSQWTTVATPHTWNESDSFDKLIVHSSGDQGEYLGIGWYRKHFKLPAEYTDRKIFIEFEGMRQAGKIYLNGKQIGLYENGITPYGIDLTGLLNFGDTENVLAVQVDNRTTYREEATGVPFEWNSKDFNPDYGGINRHVWLHVAGKIYQTLPLFYGLQTTGIYVYPSNISIANKTADITVESQVSNESGDRATVNLSAVVVDDSGKICATLSGDDSDMVNGEKDILQATGNLANANFWSPDQPYLYDVYTIVTVNQKVVDVCKTRTGFRKADFRGGAGTGGVYINDKFVYLTGYAQRSSDEWAGLGQAYPDWMHDLTMRFVRESNANYIRWMHITPQIVDVNSCDRYGIVEVSPAGDKESDPVIREQGAAENAARRGATTQKTTFVPSATAVRQWDQRVEVMRDSVIYMRNHPSILFWEAGNTVITPEHMQEMVDLRKQWDPNGMRVMGTRGDANAEENTAITPVAEYYGVMMAQDRGADALKNPKDIFRAYSLERRDRAPLVEAEDFRDEAARRFWDDYSPPEFGFKKGPLDTYNWNSETFCLAAAARYFAYYSNRISNTDSDHARWSGYASIYFTDANADGRQDSSEVARVSGKMDAVRLPKEAYYTYQVMQSPTPAIHIIGHWTYPDKTTKDMYVISNCQSVELLLNGKSIGKSSTPTNGYVFKFPAVSFVPGTLKAIGSDDGKEVCEYTLQTAGPAKALKLTPMVGPTGLQADGADVALVDVEVVDANGQRCPCEEDKVDFSITGPGIWRGGYNSGRLNSTNNLYLYTECGINRVSIRSTDAPGTITLTAKSGDLQPATIQIDAKPVKIADGIEDSMPPRLPAPDSVSEGP